MIPLLIIICAIIFEAVSIQNKNEFIVKAHNTTISYSGLINVDSLCLNIFFWFVPSVNEQVNKPPILIWLPDKNFDSGMYSFLDEITSFRLNEQGNLATRKGSINEEYPVLLIDIPAGVGYSSYRNGCHKRKELTDECFYKGYAKSECGINIHFEEFIKEFEKIFTNETNNGYYLGGRDYAGKHAASIAYYNKYDNKIKGLVLEAPLIDPISQMKSYPMNLLNTGYITLGEFNDLNKMAIDIMYKYEAQDYLSAVFYYNRFMAKVQGMVSNFTNFDDISTIGKTKLDSKHKRHYKRLLNRKDVKKTLNIPMDTKFVNDQYGSNVFKNNTVKSATKYYRKVMNSTKIFIYQGQFSLHNNIAGYFEVLDKIDANISTNKELLFHDDGIVGYMYQSMSFHFIVLLKCGMNIFLEKKGLATRFMNRDFIKDNQTNVFLF